MINEEELWYKRGDFVEFKLNLGGGASKCRGVVLNTAVLYGRGARQIWIIDMEGGTPEQNAHWVNKKIIVHEEDIVSGITSVPIGRDSLLRENPVCCPVRSFKGECETPAITVTVAIPVSAAVPPKIVEDSEQKNESSPDSGR